MAVTRDGIPVRVWCWPGNTSDSALIRQVKDDMRDWTLSRIVWVADRGFTSADNRRHLRKGDHHYIIGEKLRSGSAAAAAASRQGRYQDVAENLRVKEVRIADSERFVICFNPKGAERDAAVRERMLAQLQDLDLPTVVVDLGLPRLPRRERPPGPRGRRPGVGPVLAGSAGRGRRRADVVKYWTGYCAGPGWSPARARRCSRTWRIARYGRSSSRTTVLGLVLSLRRSAIRVLNGL